MTLLDQMREVAAVESELARATWDLPETTARSKRDRIREYVGSGLSQSEVARRTGVTQSGVRHILIHNGWKL